MAQSEPAVWRFNRALLRAPAKSVVKGLRANDRGDPNVGRLKAEHDAYAVALAAAGVEVEILPALEDFPDSVFVEDPALVFPEGAVLLRSGAESRAGEADKLAPALRERFGRVLTLPDGGTAEGGDILVTPDKILIGLSTRTDRFGAEALKSRLADLGRETKIVSTPPGVLHLKSDCALLDDETVLTTARLARTGVFRDYDEVIVPHGEETAANALRVNDVVLVGAAFPKTIEMLDRRGFNVVPLPVNEIGKLDAGLSCMSLRWYEAST